MEGYEVAEFKFLLNRYRPKYGYYQYAVFLCDFSSYKLLDIFRFCTYKSYEFVEHHDN